MWNLAAGSRGIKFMMECYVLDVHIDREIFL